MSRQTDIDDFKRLAGGADLMTWLVGTGEALDDAPLLERARQWWLLNCQGRRCICCVAPIHEVDEVGGVLMAAPMHACGQVFVSGHLRIVLVLCDPQRSGESRASNVAGHPARGRWA
jgi:hypothetical protein